VDLIHQDLETAIHDLVDLLGIQLLGEGGVGGHIGEEDGDQLALTLDGGAGGKDLLGQVLGGVGGRLGVIYGRAFGLAQPLAACPTKLPPWRNQGAAGWTWDFHAGSAFLAEHHFFPVIELANATFHGSLPVSGKGRLGSKEFSSAS
jgi:hypothetical protein